MAVHESSVNYRNLIRDLAEMYPYQVSDVVLVELIANSLDARPTTISIDFDPAARTLVVMDDGRGMTASDFDQYHDFAAGLKVRGSGIGFAGVGAKVSFNIASRVTTETRSESFSGGSNWYLQSKSRLVWEDIKPTRLAGHGTRAEVAFDKSAKLSYATTKDLLMLVKRHYLPLLCSEFLDLYDELGYYSRNLRFVVNGKQVAATDLTADYSLDNVRKFFPQKAGKKVGYGVLGLAADEYPVASDACGVLLCTYGKVIRADLFNQFPGPLGPRILGVVEIPELVNFLTTSKTDFIRRLKHADFEKVWQLGDTIFRLVEELERLSLQLDGVYEHLCRDLKVKRMWLEKVIIFRRYLPHQEVVPESLNWGQCRDNPRHTAETLQRGLPPHEKA